MPGLISESAQDEDEQDYILVFHDQSHDTVPTAKQILGSARRSCLLKSVIDACSAALHKCSSTDKNHPFASIEHAVQFCEAHGERDAVSSSVLSCFNQFGYLALLWEQHQACFQSQAASVSSVGLCTGSLTAAAVLFICSEEDIRQLAGELIAVSYRLGLEADRRSHSIDPSLSSWSIALKNASEQDARAAVDAFNQEQALPAHHHAYVSAVMPKSLTISGPPSTLQLLLKQSKDVFPNAKHVSLPIYGAFHAGHLICPDLDKIIGDARLDGFVKQANRSLIFPETANCSDSDSLASLTRLMIERCFQNELSMQSSNSPLSEVENVSNYRLVSIGNSGHAESVQDWLCGTEQLQSVEVKIENDDPLKTDIAIVGYGGRFPQAETLEEFWDIVESGKDVHEFIPKDRFDAEQFHDPSGKGKNTTSSPYGCFMKQAGAFDNTFFNMSPRESLSMDPTQRILLMVTQEALDMAGYSKRDMQNKRIGTFFGQATDDWRESHASQNIDIFYVGGGMRAFTPGRINYQYKWEGPSYSIDTACSASLAALELACRAIQAGDCDMAVAGGGNIISALPMFSGLSKGKFSSPTGACKTFDVTADGYCRGEGVGVVVIKRMDNALFDNDNVKGIVAGINTNHSAHAVSITHPHAPTQEALMRKTLNLAGLQPREIDYVEFHGTGTQAGDATELASVGEVFGDSERTETPLYIGAVKANVGHGEAAAGVTSLIKSLLMLKHNTIPPHAGIKSKANEALNKGKAAQLKVPTKAIEFAKPKDQYRRILINNFNATGGNTSMVLSSYPYSHQKATDQPLSHYPVAVSAQSQPSLRGNLEKLKAFIEEFPSTTLADLSYSTTTRRQHFQYRQVYVVDSIEGLFKSVEASLENESKQAASRRTPSVVFVFAGQGTQTQGIGAELFKNHTVFRKTLIDFNDLCVSLGFSPFLEFITEPKSEKEWTAVQLQLGVVAIEVALTRLWESLGLKPEIVLGHSLGEYPALYVAGVLSLSDMFYLVGKRASLMENHCEPYAQAMLSVGQSATQLEKLLQEQGIDDCCISCFNTDKAVVVSGPVGSLDNIGEKLKESSVKSKRLDVRYAFHSSMMDPILADFKAAAKTIPFRKPQIPVASTLTGAIVTEEGTFNQEYIVNQCRQPVNFSGALKAYQEFVDDSSDSIFIELGPGAPACLPLVQGAGVVQDRSRLISTVDKQGTGWETLLDGIKHCYSWGLEIDWNTIFESESINFTLLDLPGYVFDTQDFWFPSKPAPSEEDSNQQRQRISPLLHYVESVKSDDQASVAEFASSLADEELFAAINGHKVYDAALCPSSVYSTMALEAATYLYNQIAHGSDDTEDPQFEIYDMEIQRPLIVQASTEATLYTWASYSQKKSTITVSFSSQNGGDPMSHAQCKLRISSASEWRANWAKVDFLLQSRIGTMTSSTHENLNKLNRAVVYKLFSHVVEYSPAYHGIKSIILDNDGREATAEIGFSSDKDDDCLYDSHLVDTIIHVPGFVLNNGIDDTKYAYISDGWDALMIPSKLEKNGTYTCHTRLTPSSDGRLLTGDVYMLSDTQIVAACTGVRFSRMGLKSLRSFVSKFTSSEGTKQQDSKAVQPDTSETKKSEKENKTTASKEESSGESAIAKVVEIISNESGVSLKEISDDSTIEELGLDSILVTQVVERVKEETGLDMSAETLQSADSLGDLKQALRSLGASDGSGQKNRDAEKQSETNDTAQYNSGSSDSENSRGSAQSSSTEADEANLNIGDVFRDMIAQEAGVSAEKVEEASDLNDVGLDSLLSNEVLSLVKEKTGKEYSSSFLKDNVTMEAIRKAVNSKQPSPTSASEEKSAPDGTNDTPSVSSEKVKNKFHEFESKITFIQGDKDSSNPPLLLFPPGMGTTVVYTGFSKNPSNTPMYALQSPFLKQGVSDDFSIKNSIPAYLAAVDKVCPSGPLHIGGWSIGGAIAYEVTQQLLQAGREIQSLIVIDCPFPPNLKNQPTITFDALEMMGYNQFTKDRHGSFPRYLTEHVVVAMNSFKTYQPKPMSGDERPKYSRYVSATHGSQDKFLERALAAQAILDKQWEAEGELDFEKGREQLDKEHANTADYVECPKDDPSATGWEKLLGDDLDIKVVEADHISLLLQEKPLSILSEHVNSIV